MKIDALGARFSELLKAEGTSMESPSPLAAWRAFKALGQEAVECDDERLFFECDISPTEGDTFYINFTRTLYGREPKGHVWSFDVICDFLFELDETLETISFTVEAEELMEDSPEREEFFAEVEGKEKLWRALEGRGAKNGQIYVGES